MIDAKPAKRVRATAVEWNDIRAAFVDDRCWICDAVWEDLHHILSRGAGRGDDVIQNLAALCRECHMRIEARDPVARSLMRQALMPSNYQYLRDKLGETLEGWLTRNYPIGLPYAHESHARAGATTNQELNQALDFEVISKDDKPTLTAVTRTNAA